MYHVIFRTFKLKMYSFFNLKFEFNQPSCIFICQISGNRKKSSKILEEGHCLHFFLMNYMRPKTDKVLV